MLSRETLARVDIFRSRFETARPFPHLKIGGFLEPEIAESLYQDFPAFRPERAINEFGTVGTNCCISEIWTLGPHFKHFYDYFQSAELLDLLSRITGIPDLIADPELRGGGTHDNQEGHELDPHLDFNVQDGLHRRINVLVYMNKGWRIEWGGAIELFENGRDTLNSPRKTYNCNFNRAVIFETSERSWHEFRKIRLPAGEKHRSRRLISLYYYTKTRPGRQDIVYRTTFFCPYFPERLKDPRPLSEEDRGELVEAIQKRELQYYQEREIEVRKSYGYSAPGAEDRGETQGPESSAPESSTTEPTAEPLAVQPTFASPPTVPAPEPISSGGLFKETVRHFIGMSWWRSKRAPTHPGSRGGEPRA